MNQWACFICGVVLLTGACALQAQQASSQGRGHGSANTSNDELRSFKRAMALQAYPDQVTQFKKLAASIQAAKKAAHDLQQHAANAGNPDLSQNAEALSSAVEEAQADSEHFLRTFTKVQKSELKNLVKKLDKANSEITKESKALGHGTDASVVDRLNHALDDFEARQSDIGSEMGISDEKTPQ